MKIRNQILSFFVDASETPKVFLSPATMNDEAAAAIISKELKSKLSGKRLLHVCFDKDSKIIYLPNAQAFTKDQIEPLLQAAKYHIVMNFGDYKYMPPIEGSPFSSLRLRSIENFGYVYNAIKEHFGDKAEDIPVVEANLFRMPSTVKQLPSIYKNNKNYSGGLISKNFSDEITFFDEVDIKGKRRGNSIRLTSIKTPFILIDISAEVNPTPTEKEWAVLSGYRDYVAETAENMDNIMGFAPLYAAKRYLYLGWPFAEVCKVLLEHSKDFIYLMKGINQLLIAANALEKEGYTNPSSIPYYMSFCIDKKTFPFNFGKSKSQIPFFQVLDYDKKTNYIIIKTPAYIDSDLCLKVLKAKSRPFIARYNAAIDKIDVKCSSGVLKELQIKTDIPNKIKGYISKDIGASVTLEYRADKRSQAVSLSSNDTSHIRKISDYYYAKDHILDMCKKRNLPFEDMQVLVAPLERIFGRGVQGGFMGKKEFENSKLKIPHQIEKGLWVSPPLMAVNSESMPSYAAQTETLIHEYSHKLYSMQNPDHEHLYNKNPKLKDKDPAKYWDLYLGDADEQLAHKEEIKFELKSGKSVDEIVRDKVGGSINKDSYKRTYFTAVKFKEIVDEVVKEMEEENE